MGSSAITNSFDSLPPEQQLLRTAMLFMLFAFICLIIALIIRVIVAIANWAYQESEPNAPTINQKEKKQE